MVLFLRLFSIIFFVPLFAGVPLTFRHAEGFDPVLLWQLGFANSPWIVPFLALGLATYLLVLIHELIHGAVLRVLDPRVTFSIDGIAPRSHAASLYLTRAGAVLYAVTPFFVVSLLGVIALLLVPDRAVSRVFLPTVVHGVIAAGDFVVVAWAVGAGKDAAIAVLADGLVAYGPASAATNAKRRNKS